MINKLIMATMAILLTISLSMALEPQGTKNRALDWLIPISRRPLRKPAKTRRLMTVSF